MSGRYLLTPIRVVFQIDTTRSEASDRIGDGLNSADQREGRWPCELGRAGSRRIGPRGVLGRRERWAAEGFGPRTDWAKRAGSMCSGLSSRLGRTGRANWVGSPQLDWTGPIVLGRLD
ncbi:hypothetical protein CRG98_003852 [Punica granatum]|uniref:Uncharacterized protein n=1 Tax=Punica granatum TaxID=22663 RepID=A0A2I0L4R8_PUNGR|nr:hypothetical protein CRG98_003852 [Punica granatum]